MTIESDWEEVGESVLSTMRSLALLCSAGSRCTQLIITAFQISQVGGLLK
jgi:hypothetical protein